MTGDYCLDFNCICGAPIDVYIQWSGPNVGDEIPKCRNHCDKLTGEYLNEQQQLQDKIAKEKFENKK